VSKRTFIFSIILIIRGSRWSKGWSAIVVLIVRILLRLGFIIIVSSHIALIIWVVAHISVEIVITTSSTTAKTPSATRGASASIMVAMGPIGTRTTRGTASSIFETAAVRMMAVHFGSTGRFRKDVKRGAQVDVAERKTGGERRRDVDRKE
jgi:hypothetical protein